MSDELWWGKGLLVDVFGILLGDTKDFNVINPCVCVPSTIEQPKFSTNKPLPRHNS